MIAIKQLNTNNNQPCVGKLTIKLKEDDSEWYKNGFCVYSVKTTGLSKLYSDVNFRQGGYYTLNNIKPQNIELIKSKGFLGITCFSSSAFSHRIFIKCGFQEKNLIQYKDYEYKEEKPFESIPSPHKGLYFMMLRF